MRVAVGVVAIALVSGAATAETAPDDLYVRAPVSIDGAASSIVDWAKARGVKSLVVAFDVITFAPPPDDNEFRRSSRPERDLLAWSKAFVRQATLAPSGPSIVLATTANSDLVLSTGKDAGARVATSLRSTDWNGKQSPIAPTFASWATGVLSRLAPGKRALVLVTGDLLPENLEAGPVGPGGSASWRRLLDRPGEYWDEEKLIESLRRLDASFAVIAPEARFCDDLPVSDLPEVPWAARPAVPPDPTGDSWTGWKDVTDWDERRRQYKELGWSDERIEKQIEEDRRTSAKETAGLGRRGPSRFDWVTPRFCLRIGSRVPFNTDCPSGFGYWPFARVAGATDGVYVIYPSHGGNWLDKCPRDAALLRTLAPSLTSRREWTAARAKDPILGELLTDVAGAKDHGLWQDSTGVEGDGVWCGIAPRGAADDRWHERDKPYEGFTCADRGDHDWAKDAQQLRDLAKRYDRSSDLLMRLADRLAAHPDARSSPCTDANLRLVRFWLEMGAFHLDAMAMCLESLPHPRSSQDRKSTVVISYVPTIRLSDCLDGYDGLRISDEEEKTLAALPEDLPSRSPQANFLHVERTDPRFRARRSLDAVFAHVDKRLVLRAKRVVAAAEAVMQPYAKTPWGWMTYYSTVETFVVDVIRPTPQKVGSPGVDPPPNPGPSTPNSDSDGPRTPK